MKCPSCNAECADGAKFCEECGTAIPQQKECPKCHTVLKPTAKFCFECGYNFTAKKSAVSSPKNMNIGDKNVIAGDVIGNQESIHVAGAATIIKNEDETKKMVKCHVCGHNITIVHSVSCPVCGTETCENCFDSESNMCSSCSREKKDKKEKVYMQALKKVLEDGKVTFSERLELNALQKELGITASRASELEKLAKNCADSEKDISSLSSYIKLSLEKAMDILFDEGNSSEAYEKLEAIYKRYPQNEEVLTSFLYAAIKENPDEAFQIIRQNQVDVIGFQLILIDYALENGDLTEADNHLQKALELWPDSLLLLCRKALCLKAMYDELQDPTLLEQAADTLASIAEPKNKMEASMLTKAQCAVYAAMGDEVPEFTAEYCKTHNLYFALCSVASNVGSSIEKDKKLGIEFSEDGKTLLKFPAELELDSYRIPCGVTSIGDEAFRDCDKLTSIEIPNSVTGIGDEAFCGCKNLMNVVIPDSVTGIGDEAFYGCNCLTSIVIPDSVTSIGDGVFNDCARLKEASIPLSLNIASDTFPKRTVIIRGKSISLKSSAERNLKHSTVDSDFLSVIEKDKKLGIEFSEDGKTLLKFPAELELDSYRIPFGVTAIGDGAFDGCNKLTSIEIPNSVTEIGVDAFSCCSSLTSIVIPDSVTEILNDAFYACNGLTSIEIPNSVTEIGDGAFSACWRLTSIVIPDSVTSIRDGTFSDCAGLTSIVIPDSVTSIEDAAFNGCKLTKVVIPDSVTSIGDYVFSELKEVSIPFSLNISSDTFPEKTVIKRRKD